MTKVIIDCDPGHDDALAILLAGQHLDILGITTVAGNQTLDKVTANALKIVELMDRTDIPVFRGARDPLLRKAVHAGHIHGESGLDGPDLPTPVKEVESRHAVDFIVQTLMAEDDVWLAPVGPLTNVALAIRQCPEIVSRMGGISLMGGSLTTGNSTATAEFNIWFDAEAARIVYESGAPIKMCGLNLTQQANATNREVERIRNRGNRVGEVVAQLLEFYLDAGERMTGIRKSALNDPCAVAALIHPALLEFEAMHVSVETQGELTYGMTVCDYRHLRGFGSAQVDRGPLRQEANVEVAMKIDEPGFLDLLIDALGRY